MDTNIQPSPTFQVGERVVHWIYGPGEVIKLEEKELSGQAAQYYVVQLKDMTIWVPADNTNGKSSLRRPTSADQFQHLFAILSSPGEPLSQDRMERKTQVLEAMRDGTIESVCRVIRDLSFFGRTKKLNDYDVSTLERAQNFLLNEWKLALSVPFDQAQEELKLMLGKATL